MRRERKSVLKQQDRDDFGISLGSRSAAAVRLGKPLRLKLLAAGFLLFAILSSGAASAFETPQQVGAAFCAARMKNDEKQVRALLSPSLLEVIEEAETRNDAIAKATPDEKPPLGDGIPWQGFPDQAPLCKAGEAKQVPGRTEVLVRYEFPDTPNAGWTDKLLLVSAGSGLLIDDILYQIPANHTEQIGLRSVLFNAFDQ